jgi:hypothetical protein
MVGLRMDLRPQGELGDIVGIPDKPHKMREKVKALN